MNIINIEITIRSLKLPSLISDNQHNQGKSKIQFSLRMGKILSPLVPLKNGNTQLALTCNELAVKDNPRICLIVYAVLGGDHHKNKPNNSEHLAEISLENNIVGMVFIITSGTQNQFKKYKIQQCEDTKAEIQLAFCKSSLEVRNRETSSQASKSSYSQIQQFHNALSKVLSQQAGYNQNTIRTQEHQHTDFQNEQFNMKMHKKIHRRIDSSHTHSQTKQHTNPRNLNKTPYKKNAITPRNTSVSKRIKTEEVPAESGESSQYSEQNITNIGNIKNQLTKALDKNLILANLLIIEETKFKEAQAFIKRLAERQGLTKQDHNIKGRKQTFNNPPVLEKKKSSLFGLNMQNTETQNIQEQNQYIEHKQNHSRKNSKYPQELELMTKQRDQLYQISQELFERTKFFKQQNQRLVKWNKSLEAEAENLKQKVESEKKQYTEVKKQLFQLSDRYNQIKNGDQDSMSVLKHKIRQLETNIEQFSHKNKQNQRKLKESFKAITDFKNDALEARELIIIRDQEIQKLKNKIQPKYNISDASITDQKSMISQQVSIVAIAKLLKKHLLAAQSCKQKYMLMNKNKIKVEQIQNQVDVVKILEDIKKGIVQICSNYKKKKKQTISVLEMRRDLMLFLNSYIVKDS